MSKAMMKRLFWRQVLHDLEEDDRDLDRAASPDWSNPVEARRHDEALSEIRRKLRRMAGMDEVPDPAPDDPEPDGPDSASAA
jgi:hypothetical protein